MGKGQKIASVHSRADTKVEGQHCPHVSGVRQGPAESPGTTRLTSPRWRHHFNPHLTAGKLRFKETGPIGEVLRAKATHSPTHAFSSIDGEPNDVLGPELETLELV